MTSNLGAFNMYRHMYMCVMCISVGQIGAGQRQEEIKTALSVTNAGLYYLSTIIITYYIITYYITLVECGQNGMEVVG